MGSDLYQYSCMLAETTQPPMKALLEIIKLELRADDKVKWKDLIVRIEKTLDEARIQ